MRNATSIRTLIDVAVSGELREIFRLPAVMDSASRLTAVESTCPRARAQMRCSLRVATWPPTFSLSYSENAYRLKIRVWMNDGFV